MSLVAGEDLGAWIVRTGGRTRRHHQAQDVEVRLSRYRDHQPLLVPGHLQSPGYTIALANAAGLPDAEAFAQTWTERQASLEQPGAPKYEALIDVRCLMRHPGGGGVLVEQLDFLLRRMELPAITVRAVPETSTARAMARSAFAIYEFRDPASGPLVRLETQSVDAYLAEPDDLAAYERLWDGLSADALSVKATRAWLLSQRKAAS